MDLPGCYICSWQKFVPSAFVVCIKKSTLSSFSGMTSSKHLLGGWCPYARTTNATNIDISWVLGSWQKFVPSAFVVNTQRNTLTYTSRVRINGRNCARVNPCLKPLGHRYFTCQIADVRTLHPSSSPRNQPGTCWLLCVRYIHTLVIVNWGALDTWSNAPQLLTHYCLSSMTYLMITYTHSAGNLPKKTLVAI